MKTSLSGSVLAAIAGAALLLPLAAEPAAAQVPGGSYLQSCRNVHATGDRVVATCRTEEGRWNRTSIGNVDRCAGGLANADGRLVCGTRGGRVNVGRDRGPDYRHHYGWRGDRHWDGYGSSYDRRHWGWGQHGGSGGYWGGWYGR